MFCSKCGKEIDDNARFCPECGNNIISSNSFILKIGGETKKKILIGSGITSICLIIALCLYNLLSPISYDFGFGSIKASYNPFLCKVKGKISFLGESKDIERTDVSIFDYIGLKKKLKNPSDANVKNIFDNYSGDNNSNSYFLNNDKSFKIKEIKESIKNIDKYKDSVNKKGYGFIYDVLDLNELKILKIYKDSPAEEAGLEVGDIIIKINKNDTSKGYNREDIDRELKKDKIKLVYLRDGNTYSITLHKKYFINDNIMTYPSTVNPNIYLNSMSFKNEYILSYFKVVLPDGDYEKEGAIINCNANNKSIAVFWRGKYGKYDILAEVYDYLNDHSVSESPVTPNTYGETMWHEACFFINNWSESDKTEYMKRKKDILKNN